MTKSTTVAVLLLLAISIAMVASCGKEIVGPTNTPDTNNPPAALSDTDPPDDDNGTRTPGYWKNHSASWPVGQLTLGAVEYSKQRCIEMLGKPARGDHSVILCRALIAAKLNVLNGCDGSCVEIEIAGADVWFAQYNLANGAVDIVVLSDRGRPLADVLDDFNNGLLCAPASKD